MAGFVLIHGAFHGGWCFDPVVELLRAKGHEVVAPDLPGMGGDEAALRAATLDGWARFTVEACRSLRGAIGDAPLVLAGHSRGGAVISAAAEADPFAMDSLAYVCAMMIPPAMTPETAGEIIPPGAGVRQIVTLVENGAGMMPDPAQAARYFAQLSPPELAEAAAQRLVPEPVGVNAGPPRVSWERWGTVPRLYVECTEDLAIPIAQQRRMVELAPETAVFTLETDHSPFYSDPEGLAGALESAAEGLLA